jgi:hypothetical protein
MRIRPCPHSGAMPNVQLITAATRSRGVNWRRSSADTQVCPNTDLQPVLSHRQKGHHNGLGAIILTVRMKVSRGLMTLRTEARLRRRFHDQSDPIRFGRDALQPQKLRIGKQRRNVHPL